MIQNRFQSEAWIVLKLLTFDTDEMLTLDMDYRGYEKYKHAIIKEHFSTFTYADYERFLDQCFEISKIINQDQKKSQFHDGIINVFLALSETRAHLFCNVLEQYLIRGDHFRINARSVIKRLVESVGLEMSFDILNRHDYPTKRTWLFWWFTFLPSDAVTVDRLNHLYTLYGEAASSDIVCDFEYLLKFRKIDQRVVPKVIEIILGRAQIEPNLAHTLYWLFNSCNETNEV